MAYVSGVILLDMEFTSLYLHVPFCKHRCVYCDFNTYTGIESLIPSYVEALCNEVRWVSQKATNTIAVHTIYIGGGTPSLLSIGQIEQVLLVIGESFDLQEGMEISIETNPGTLSREYLRGLRDLGINRLSLGMQSAHQADLTLLERIHNYPDVINAIMWASIVGIENINLDLIFGIPGQNLERWEQTLELTLGLKPKHLALYALTLEPGTRMEYWVRRGLLPGYNEDLVADMYELADTRLEQAGYQSYEISNWATKDNQGRLVACQHNIQYWKGKPYIGLGAGAHGYLNHSRTANVMTPETYIKQMAIRSGYEKIFFPCTPATEVFTVLTPEDEMGEVMMMGLRLTEEGVSDNAFRDRFGKSLDEVYGVKINKLLGSGLLEWVLRPELNLRLTKRGRLLGNTVFREFI